MDFSVLIFSLFYSMITSQEMGTDPRLHHKNYKNINMKEVTLL